MPSIDLIEISTVINSLILIEFSTVINFGARFIDERYRVKGHWVIKELF